MAEWIYNQRTGQLRDPAGQVDRNRGYSGAPGYVNTPEAEGRRDQGPIPRGTYNITRETQSRGEITLELVPDGHDARGRTDLRIHGDSTRHPGQASQGCIILNRRQRERIRDSLGPERRIIVVDEPEWQ